MKKYTVYIEQTNAQVIEVLASDPYIAARKAKKKAKKETEYLVTAVEWPGKDTFEGIYGDDLESVNG